MPQYNLKINGSTQSVDVDEDTPLLWVIRDELKLKGTKFGCGIAQCGACTIHVNGEAVRSCSTPVSTAGDKEIETIEYLGERRLNAVQEAWIEFDVPQCGYCQSGQIMSATALLRKNARPTESEIERAMAGNICRCGTYPQIKKAIQKVAEEGGRV